MVVYLEDESEPQHKWLNKPMSFHEIVAEIIETALYAYSIPIETVSDIEIISRPYGKSYGWAVYILGPVVEEQQEQHLSEERHTRLQELRAKHSTLREKPGKVRTVIYILYSEGDFYPDVM